MGWARSAGMRAAASRPGTNSPSAGAAGAGKEGRTVPQALRRLPGDPAELRTVPGLYWHRVTDQSGRHFYEDTWKVAPEADRIGYRFKGGRALKFVPRKQPFGAGSDPSNIVDACYPYGSIQVPGGTEPIVLHRDAVSGGGYFMVGTVISADMDLIGQLQPHTPTKFVMIDVPVVLGSRSTYPLGALGGHEGRSLRAGDQLDIGRAAGAAREGRSVPQDLRRLPGNPAELRAVPGLYWHRVTDQSGRHFYEDTWKVAPEADRIGYRFKGGRALEFVPREQPFGAGSDPSNIVDACYPYGSIQVPGGTEPIVLHRDAVSGGGYFMVGTVISADMDLIGQLQPHTPTKFVMVDVPTALTARHDRAALLAKVRAAVVG